jgi:thiol-disulfide isomerase/thioredoxin
MLALVWIKIQKKTSTFHLSACLYSRTNQKISEMHANLLAFLLSAILQRPSIDSGFTTVKVKMTDAAGYTMRFIPKVTEDYTEENGYRIYKFKIPYDQRRLFVVSDPAHPPPLILFLKKGAELTIEGTAKTPGLSHITSTDNDVMEYEIYRSRDATLDQDLWQANSDQLKLKALDDTAGVSKTEKRVKDILKQKTNWQREYVKEYPHGRASLEIFNLFYQRLDSQEAWQVFSQYPDSLKQEGAGKDMAGFFDALRHTEAGSPVIPFKQEGIDGKPVDIAALKGKVLIIDFWGSWCGPCRRSHPHLRSIYEKYHDRGLEIIGIAYEGGTPAMKDSIWRKAVKEDGMTWLQILNDPDRQDLTKRYSVTAFPTKLIVDREGKIVFRVSDSFSEEFDRKLEDLFK